ncbi:AbrB family transcriptional regulator [Candidatus Falkowbacteria bacterium CG10_big_fil_rev_8_21_14_0_10_39_11]|uniref:AbrB family transcriptional regulator n=1 Tax=Candidatus Falkowbacteria bacterium CG10_big_fil_rev_8_21_14_0_10_39_11 TaxID=1974565 RepID=A0A2H0V551_9BACT|nr:MAG: AbrB family transcriptional regulator [Candidatus Falkowbacteria bacterium CG10_big_fil_rev_8_21_14_0_10_39_11]
MKKNTDKQFFGTATIGEKGQIVIPSAARKKMKLNKGDQLLVFGPHDEMIALVKLSEIENIITGLSEKLNSISDSIKKKKK